MPKQKKAHEANKGAICKACNGNMREVDGCKPLIALHVCKQYERVKVGDAGDFYEQGNAEMRCSDCGAKFGYFHHFGCDCEMCPVCGGQVISCECDIRLGA